MPAAYPKFPPVDSQLTSGCAESLESVPSVDALSATITRSACSTASRRKEAISLSITTSLWCVTTSTATLADSPGPTKVPELVNRSPYLTEFAFPAGKISASRMVNSASFLSATPWLRRAASCSRSRSLISSAVRSSAEAVSSSVRSTRSA